MPTAWFVILAYLLIGYAVLDGFDLGVGVLHLLVARTDEERRTALTAIGPVWDGNEVWLIVWGASLFLSFPRAYAAGFSGFYLPLIIVLWLLMGRGIGIEFRHHVSLPIWRGAWDVVFTVSSVLLAVLYGVAVGNVIAGVPLNAAGYFQGLFGWMLNPYALLMGLFSVILLALHGANYLAMKTLGPLQDRARHQGAFLWGATLVLVIALTIATFAIHPTLSANFRAVPVLILVPLAGLALLLLMRRYQLEHRDGRAFLCSAGVIISLLAATGIGLYPYLLPSSPNPARSLTIYNAAASPTSLISAFFWIIPGLILNLGYTYFVYRTFVGKTVLEEKGFY